MTLDLFWDKGVRQYQFCPVVFPKTGSERSSPIASRTVSISSTASLSSVGIGTSESNSAAESNSSPAASSSQSKKRNSVRQQASSTEDRPPENVSPSTSATSSTTVVYQTTVPTPGTTLYHLGPYQCSRSLNFQFFVSLLKDYLDATENTLQANLLYIEINLHAARSSNDSDTSVALPNSDLPGLSENLGLPLEDAISSYVYPPSQLSKDRSNLNASWFSAGSSVNPIAEYFTSTTHSDGTLSSPDGWPCEAYIQNAAHKRALVTWGTIDTQMDRYDLNADNSVIFSPGAFKANHAYTASGDGSLSSGCFYQQDTTRISSANSSWATADLSNPDSSPSDLSLLASNLTSCGISPILNQPLLSTPASQNLSLYHAISTASIWNWAPSEPRNSTTNPPSPSSNSNPDSTTSFRCALHDLRPSFHGHWRVADCTTQYHAACRLNNQPYEWTISSSTVPYASASSACPSNSTFSVPRTALENTHLYHHLLSLPHFRAPDPASDASAIWIDFNSLRVPTCWVSGGATAACPYQRDDDAQQQRTVVIPIIASIIALVITALTLFVKCNANRRTSRRRKRGEGGWDYEGVPS
ncbi:MAG: hypothetical protein Q9160_002869 [Pyrenula sp. 1 TL-2023]